MARMGAPKTTLRTPNSSIRAGSCEMVRMPSARATARVK